MNAQLATTSHAFTMPFTARGLVVPDPAVPLNRFQIADVACAMILEREGKLEGARFIMDRLERDLGVTDHDRLVAAHGRDVIAGAHCRIDRPRRARLRARKPAVDPAVFTQEDLRQIAKAERKIKSPDEDTRLRGSQDLQAIVDRRHARIMSARTTEADAETVALTDLRDGAVVKSKAGRLRRVDGLELLRSTGAITTFGLACARRYGELYVATQPRHSIRSCMAGYDQVARPIQQRTDEELAMGEQEAKSRLNERRRTRSLIEMLVIKSVGAKALLLLQQVAGEGASIASLATSGTLRTTFRLAVIKAVAVLEVAWSGGNPVEDEG
jgi:hypothetical protein